MSAEARHTSGGVGDAHAASTPRRSPEPDPIGMAREELRAYLRSHPTVSLWPFSGRALGVSRSLTYQLAREGGIRVLVLGHRRLVASAWLEKTLFEFD